MLVLLLHMLSPREERAAEWVTEWAANGDESPAALLERFALHEIAVWRRDNLTPSAAAGARRRNMQSEHMRYLGCLGLLGECAVHVPEDLREQIEYAMADACEATPGLKYRRILNRLEIEFMPEPTR